jgi:hypothetical protein
MRCGTQWLTRFGRFMRGKLPLLLLSPSCASPVDASPVLPVLALALALASHYGCWIRFRSSLRETKLQAPISGLYHMKTLWEFVASMATNCSHHSSHRTAKIPYDAPSHLIALSPSPSSYLRRCNLPVRQVSAFAFADGFRLRSRLRGPGHWPARMSSHSTPTHAPSTRPRVLSTYSPAPSSFNTYRRAFDSHAHAHAHPRCGRWMHAPSIDLLCTL